MGHAEHHRHLTLNTDGRDHPIENALTITVAVLGAAAAILAFFPEAHVVGSLVGLIGFATGIYAQYRSATTAERWVILIGWGASGVGLAVSLSNGGFY